jgi:hypothetical protein
VLRRAPATGAPGTGSEADWVRLRSHVIRVATSSRERARTTGEPRTQGVGGKESGPRPDLLVRGRFPLAWRCQDSNLGRHSRQVFSFLARGRKASGKALCPGSDPVQTGPMAQGRASCNFRRDHGLFGPREHP